VKTEQASRVREHPGHNVSMLMRASRGGTPALQEMTFALAGRPPVAPNAQRSGHAFSSSLKPRVSGLSNHAHHSGPLHSGTCHPCLFS